MMQIRKVQASDLRTYLEHDQRLWMESGRDGNLIFLASEHGSTKTLEDLQQQKLPAWQRTCTEVGWERAWVIADDSRIYGKIQLVHMPSAPTCLHRATLMMGMESTVRGQGWGSKLMHTAIDWAKMQDSLEYIQLFVFAHNTPALTLYKKFGFVQDGYTADAFRVFGKSVDDISMVLKL